VQAAVERFGGIDILVNNASAISLTPTPATPMKRFDLMFGVNVRGTYCCTQACLPALTASAKAGRNPHVLNMSPPLSMKPHWFKHHTAYTMAKYGMSMCTLGHAAEFAPLGIAVNSLWPRTAIDTAALQMIPGVDTHQVPQAGDPGRRRAPDPDQRRRRRRAATSSSTTPAGRARRDRPRPLRVVPGTTDFIPDFFVE
jgi:citronellol/citronellal dehydrogenase